MPERKRSILARILAATVLAATLSSTAWAQATEQVIYTFTGGNDGGFANGGMVIDSQGNLYGTTCQGGLNGGGTLFKLTPNTNGTWTEQVLYNFSDFSGYCPQSNLVFDSKGNLYATTYGGGANFQGTIFELVKQTNGTFAGQVLYNFTGGSDGGMPEAGVIVDGAGNLFGTTLAGGSLGFGTVFELVPGTGGTWSEKVLYTFNGGSDAGEPFGPVILDSNGNLYGTATKGGAHDYGVIFELSPGANGVWTEKIIHSFTGGTGGICPFSGVVFDKAGNLYVETDFYVLQLTPGSNGMWTAKNVHDFAGGSDGAQAYGGLAFDQAGNLYGMTGVGGLHMGTVFELSPGANGTWTEKVLHKFAGGSDGAYPQYPTLAVDTAGNVYGETPRGGASSWGVVFQVKP
jgi:uncharacterized repeat protein (TIGR03803 family)